MKSKNGRQKEYCVKNGKCVVAQNGKGDSPRPTDKENYDKNYQKIDWSKKKKKKNKKE